MKLTNRTNYETRAIRSFILRGLRAMNVDPAQLSVDVRFTRITRKGEGDGHGTAGCANWHGGRASIGRITALQVVSSVPLVAGRSVTTKHVIRQGRWLHLSLPRDPF